MDITGIAGQETWAMFGRMVILTFFYAGAAWVLLRLIGALLHRLQKVVNRRERPRRVRRRRPAIHAGPTVHVIR
jgi:hypothetical protein